MWRGSVAGSEPAGARAARVTFLELFFDLVFVFALTRIVARAFEGLVVEPGGSAWFRALTGAGKTLLLLLALYALWRGTAWTTSRYDPESIAVQAVVAVALGAGLVMGVAVVRAFSGYAEAFAIAYVVGQLTRPLVLHFALRDRQRRLLMRRMFITYSATGVLWITGGIIDGRALVPLWVLALGIEYAAGRFGWPVPGLGRSVTAEWGIAGEHLAERYQQFFLIAPGRDDPGDRPDLQHRPV